MPGSQFESRPYKTIITNIGVLLTGDLQCPVLNVDTVICLDGIITMIGMAKDFDLSDADLLVDVKKTTVMPGLIDNHTHPTLGEFSPRSGNHKLGSNPASRPWRHRDAMVRRAAPHGAPAFRIPLLCPEGPAGRLHL